MSIEAEIKVAEKTATRKRHKRLSSRVQSSALIIGELIVLVCGWQLAIVIFSIKPYLLPPPSAVGETFVSRFGYLMNNMAVTLSEILTGFAIAATLGITLAVLMVTSKLLEKLVYPLLVATQAVPKIAIAPMLVIWMGFGKAPIITIAALIAFFPIAVATVVGLKEVSREMISLGQVMGLSWSQQFIKIRFPKALPIIFGGLKVGMALATIGAVVGEFVGARAGLGAAILISTANFDMALTFAVVFTTAAVGMVLFWVMQWIESIMVPWK